jgi:hypothetical protein
VLLPEVTESASKTIHLKRRFKLEVFISLLLPIVVINQLLSEDSEYSHFGAKLVICLGNDLLQILNYYRFWLVALLLLYEELSSVD